MPPLPTAVPDKHVLHCKHPIIGLLVSQGQSHVTLANSNTTSCTQNKRQTTVLDFNLVAEAVATRLTNTTDCKQAVTQSTEWYAHACTAGLPSELTDARILKGETKISSHPHATLTNTDTILLQTETACKLETSTNTVGTEWDEVVE